MKPEFHLWPLEVGTLLGIPHSFQDAGGSAGPHHVCPVPEPTRIHVLSRCPQVYEGGSNVDQFVTRFLLKETANQIQSLLSSVESAVEAIEEQTSQIRCVRGTYWGYSQYLTFCAPQDLGAQVPAPLHSLRSFPDCNLRINLGPSTRVTRLTWDRTCLGECLVWDVHT